MTAWGGKFWGTVTTTGVYTASTVVARIPSAQHLRVAPERLHVLVEVDWPGGSRRYSDAPVAVGSRGYDGRLMSLSPIIKGSTGRQSSVTIALDNLCVFLDSVESLWTDDDPPENSACRVYYWFETDSGLQAIELFRGVVEEVQNLSESSLTFSAASTEGFDRLIGTEIDATAFPDAPEESLGKMQPLVFGALAGFQPIASTQIGRSFTSTITLKTAATIDLEDASRFPSSGTLQIQDERITYTGKNGNSLTGCTRGVSSTIATGYAEGISVVEIGDAQYLIAQHAVTSVSNVYALIGERKRLLPATDYTLDLTGPSTITFSQGTPQLSVPAGGSSFMEIQFDEADSQCTAENPTFACADNSEWTAKNAARLEATAGKRDLIIQQDDDPEPVGDILQTWLSVEFDNRAFPLGGGGEIQVFHNTSLLGTIDDASGNIDSEIMNRVGVGLIRGYNDEHNHIVTTSGTSVTNVHTEDKLGTATALVGWATNISNINADGSSGNFAQNNDTSGSASFEVTGFSFPANTVSFKLVCVAGYDGDVSYNNSFHMRYYRPGLTTNPHGIVVKDTFVQPTTDSPFTYRSSAINYTAAHAAGKIVIEQTAGRSRCHRAYLEVTSHNVTTTNAFSTSYDEEPLVHTRLYLFDTTSLIPDWGSFKGATATARYNSGTGGATFDIVRMSYIVKYAEKRLEPCNRILCDVTGLAHTGKPADVLKAIVTDASTLAEPVSRYNTSDLVAVEASHDALNYKLGFSVEKKVRALDLIKRVAWQSRLLWFEEFGQLCFRYQDDLASLPTASITYRTDDVVMGSFKRSRTTLRDVSTRVTASYNYSWEFGRLDSVVAENTPSATYEAKIGERPQAYDYDMIRSTTTATNLRGFMVERYGKPRWRAYWKTYLPGLEVRRGDIVALDIPDASYTSIEVVEVRIAGVEIEISGIVWDSL